MVRRARSHGLRRRLLLIGLTVAALISLGRAIQLQAVQGESWAAMAVDQQRKRLTLPAPRGVIYDRNGVPLAASREVFRLAVAPRELRDRSAVAERLRATLGLSEARVRRIVDPQRRWVVLPGRYDAAVRGRLGGVRGIYFKRVMERFYPHGRLAAALVGRVSPMGRPLGGIELEFDSLLSGRPGMAVVRRNALGEPIPGAMLPVDRPEPGRDVYLTIDYRLQAIARQALERAIERTGALGGDLIFADPQTGEILAAVSRRARGGRSWRAPTEPFEPGSTMKPFLVSMLLAEGLATLDDSVYAEQGRYRYLGRTVSDTHDYGWLTVREALRYSSNISMVKLSDRLRPATQYRYLRGFGFGAPTGVRYPSESSGVLRLPSQWSAYSQGSLAIGYEIGVTPLQLVMAYGALANGGVLMEPRLVLEVRARDGRVVREFEPQAVRRVVPEDIAAAVTDVLVEVVEGGTGTRAALHPFEVAGKTGTAHRFRGGRYLPNGYTASFAGFFPADDPQLVFLVKINRPTETFYGGSAAAPVSRKTLEAALAAHGTPIDRGAVLASLDSTVVEWENGAGAAARARRPRVEPRPTSGNPAPAPGPYVFALDGTPPERYRPTAGSPRHRVPDVSGLTLRGAAAMLHAAGFRVRIEGSGIAESVRPPAGTRVTAGTLVRVRGSEAAS